MKYLSAILFWVIILITSCAKVGNPEGGIKDEIEPKFLGATPTIKSINIDKNLKRITLYFDEFVVLKNLNQIQISPSLQTNPKLIPIGLPKKYVRIELEEPLQENTTYNINFANSITDYKEGNPAAFFNYVFSTGSYIDSLQITGSVKDLNGEKISENTLVGLFKIDTVYTDSTLITDKPYYLTRINEEGNYNLTNLKEGKYKLVAFTDEVANVKIDAAKEKYDFKKDILVLEKDTTANFSLFSSKTEYRVKNISQVGYGNYLFEFEGNPEKVKIKSLDSTFTTKRIIHKPKSDTLNFWFNPAEEGFEDKNGIKAFSITYQDQVDTLKVLNKVIKVEKEKYLNPVTTPKSLNPLSKVKIDINVPIKQINQDSVLVYRITPKDTTEVDFSYKIDSIKLNRLWVNLNPDWKVDYFLKLLPGAIKDMHNITNDTIDVSLKATNKNLLGNLYLTLENKPKTPFFIELYNANKLISRDYTSNTKHEYLYLQPGKYTVKILVDENQNEEWDTGDLLKGKKPEKTYIQDKTIEVRALWDVKETWKL